jgi:hypothetical protein
MQFREANGDEKSLLSYRPVLEILNQLACFLLFPGWCSFKERKKNWRHSNLIGLNLVTVPMAGKNQAQFLIMLAILTKENILGLFQQ